jgi:hypothetical protein
MAADPAPWAALHARASGLGPERRAAFALACAEHLVRITGAKPDLLITTAEGWAALAGGTADLPDRIVELDTRSDCDDDDVACVAHALETVVSPQPAQNVLGAVDGAIAAAYDRVPYPEGATAFRPLSEDTRDPAVQQELTWQARTLTILERVDDFAEACARLRSPSS